MKIDTKLLSEKKELEGLSDNRVIHNPGNL